MSIKNAMQQYFRLRIKLAHEGLDFLLKTPVLEEVNPILYDGEIDEEGYILWKPVEKNIVHDFIHLEQEMDIHFHQTVITYFNSYWFAELNGFYKNYYIELEAVLPNIELHSFKERLKGYKGNLQERLKHIPIGIEGNGMLVVIDNENGKVKLEDFERSSFETISENIQELILNLRLKR
ncbi:SecY-interacting protein Syd [Bacillus pseudomycoides]|uniref:SecY-interacting protein Syd n=1 Tax=Bacillus TaxID=1386 RepID=UPI000BF24BF3|nr:MULTISPECIES: SecY-interacting protein Syd [Bacillus]MCX2824555.1 SecY-interacting protein Syd [Bacillus sp. DHT2]MDR4915713.1 SecY-interacting protein Syd [Bacillus pseudomycoides]PEM35169.1 SecY interacting protein Syd [Bacillus pseudomycoides]